MLRPPIMTPFICSKASCAASGISYSTKAKPLCFCVTGSQDILMDLIGLKQRTNKPAHESESLLSLHLIPLTSHLLQHKGPKAFY
ncbi:hypothetical protein ALC60_10959 [Trachymyrmex zeteki]|uniref:Uncharacterized protein n=1 Tax=Mycetomoellerius zeteki TaxID=64791 RepID=A0A151WQ58_9HYME|nr:hypothetical protein ALC60_10959 [Trachymyrmex zeteki]